MTFLADIIDEHRNIMDDATFARFLAAMKYSLTTDPMTHDYPSFDNFGFSIQALYSYRILLLKPLAYQFLSEHDFHMSEAAFKRKTTIEAYESHFGRNPLLIHSKPRIMLLTYSEWAQWMLGDYEKIVLPQSLT